MTDTFDAVLAEMREQATRWKMAEGNPNLAPSLSAVACAMNHNADRLAAAHAAEVAERDAVVRKANAQAEDFERRYYLAMDRAEAAERDARSKQARIDALMLEYCPEEMTPEQVAEWKGAIATTEQAGT